MCNILQQVSCGKRAFWTCYSTRETKLRFVILFAFMLASAHHSKWVTPSSLCVLLCFPSHLRHLSEKVGAFLSRFHAWGGKGKENVPQLHGPGRTGPGKLCLEFQCVCAQDWGEMKLRTLMISVAVTCEPSQRSCRNKQVA